MQKPPLRRRLVLAVLWAFALSTWASIGHHLLGLPNVGPLLVLFASVMIVAWPSSALRAFRAHPAVQRSVRTS